MMDNDMEITKELIESIQIIDTIIYNENDSIDIESYIGITVETIDPEYDSKHLKRN